MAANEKDVLINRIIGFLLEAFRAPSPEMRGEWLRADLTMPQAKVLLLLLMDGPSRMSDLAHSLGVSMATTTGVVDRLVERKLVVREAQPGDRRVVVCDLSEEGRKVVELLWELGQSQHRRILDHLTVPQLQIVAQALELIAQAAKATGQADALPSPPSRRTEPD